MKNPIQPNLKTEIIPILLLIITGIIAMYFYQIMPNQIPLHWNLVGEVDKWGSKFTGVITIPLITLFTYLLMLGLPKLDPQKKRYEEFKKTYHIFKAIIILFFTVLYFTTSLYALGFNIAVNKVVPFLIGLMFIFFGNYMSKIKKNWFLGIKTPWTLSSDNVWNKTHRVGGKIFILSGILFILEPFLPLYLQNYVFIIIIIGIIFGTFGYSYIAYKNEKK